MTPVTVSGPLRGRGSITSSAQTRRRLVHLNGGCTEPSVRFGADFQSQSAREREGHGARQSSESRGQTDCGLYGLPPKAPMDCKDALLSGSNNPYFASSCAVRAGSVREPFFSEACRRAVPSL
jgi:hypothetical protein